MDEAVMTSRSRRDTIIFRHPFDIRSIGRCLAAGSYEVVTDEDMIEGVSFASYRRMSTMMLVPALSPHGSMEMITIDPAELVAARNKDAAHG